MNTTKKIIVSLCIVFLFCSVSVFGQSLFDSEYYKKTIELQKKAETAFDNGEYDLSYQYSREAGVYRSYSELYGMMMYYRYKANGSIVVAGNRLSYARGIKADVNFPDDFSAAKTSYEEAKRLFDEGEVSYGIVRGYLGRSADEIEKEPFESGTTSYIESHITGKLALAALENIKVVEKSGPAAVLAVPKNPALPRYYVVRLIPNERDCFWRIAGYSFVYGDPYKWRLLYELNKGKLPDPKNPNWIEPGMIIEIPSLKGEVREGTYDPALTYPPLKK